MTSSRALDVSGEKPGRAVAAKAPPRKVQPELFRRPSYLRMIGPEARTIFDIGVARGTNNLYRAFHDRKFILVEPQVAGESILRFKPNSYQYVNKALGSKPGRLMFNDAIARSSFLGRTELSAIEADSSYEVDVVTFDSLVEELKPEGPLGVKIDAEGFELEIIKGMEKSLDLIEFIICEIHVMKLYEGGYMFGDLVAYLHDRKFEFFNFLNHPKPAPRFYDVVFLKRDNKLFMDMAKVISEQKKVAA
jgi:FkbM family methyltransferase